jgi:hypothetical protein
MIHQPASAFEIIQIVQQKRQAQAAISKPQPAANANGVGPAHIRAALLYATRKAG